MFEEAFLRSKNHDCLSQVLSFLKCHELANVARTCKVLQHTIFETDELESNVDLIWQGAEEKLTNRLDVQPIVKEYRRVGSNAREHCHLFTIASKAAKECELSDEIDENRIKVDGVLANLMNVRGYDAASVAEKKAIGERETRAPEEAFSPMDFRRVDSMSDAEHQENKRQAQEAESLRKEKWEKMKELRAPTKTYHHNVFVRITRTATGDLISEGFCKFWQKFPWFAGLELSRDYRGFQNMNQGLQISLIFESLKQSEEMQGFLGSLSTGVNMFDAMRGRGLGIKLTAVVIDRRNHSTQCLFQQHLTEDHSLRMVGPGYGAFCGARNHEFSARPRWEPDSIQLGPSVAEDLYYLDFSLCLNVVEYTDGSLIFLPTFEVNVQEDRRAHNRALAEALMMLEMSSLRRMEL